MAALAAKQLVRPTARGNGASSTSEDSPPATHGGKMTASFLDWDSTSSDESNEEQDEEQLSNKAVQKEVSTNYVLFCFSLTFSTAKQDTSFKVYY